jgi:hypothetical protein
MERLVDAEKLKADFVGKRYGTQAIEYVIDQQPTVDAVRVIRCKDCEYNYHNMIPSGEAEHGCTKCVELPITADFYCAWGKRKDE